MTPIFPAPRWITGPSSSTWACTFYLPHTKSTLNGHVDMVSHVVSLRSAELRAYICQALPKQDGWGHYSVGVWFGGVERGVVFVVYHVGT